VDYGKKFKRREVPFLLNKVFGIFIKKLKSERKRLMLPLRVKTKKKENGGKG
jgi:hypothetical protein